jgi:cell division septum initiation protein DivIVA
MEIGEPGPSPQGEDEAGAAGSEDAGLPASTFDTVRRGFAPDQVAEYLQRVTTLVLSLEARLNETTSELLETKRERDEARAALEASAARDPNDGASDRVTELVHTFDHEVSGLLREAEVEAERLRSDVRMEADRILALAREEAKRFIAEADAEAERIRADARMLERESQARAGRLIIEARQEADRAESHLATVRGQMLDTFRDIRERTITALGEVEALIESGAASDRVVIVDEAVELAGDEGPGLAADDAAGLAPADLPAAPRRDP